MRLVKEKIAIGASLDTVWAILENFGDVATIGTLRLTIFHFFYAV